MKSEVLEAMAASAVVEPVAIQSQFNVVEAFNGQELEALERLVSVRMKPLEINAIETQYPSANAVELFIIYKMKQLAADEAIAYEWRENQKNWKLAVLVATRNVLKTDENIRKRAEHELVELNDNISLVHHEAIIKSVIVDLDKGSKDERVLQMQKFFKA